jgi:DNA topoisomerase-2
MWQVTEAVATAANKKSKKDKGMQIKAFHVKNHLSVFVNCLIENPAFDSQTKDTLTTRPKAFGTTAVLPEKMVKAVRGAAFGYVCERGLDPPS